MEWETVIGLEIHAQLMTKSKIFSGSSIAYGAEPNTQANVVDLAMPGVLPVLNIEAVRMAAKFGLGINAPVSQGSVFARKNYLSTQRTNSIFIRHGSTNIATITIKFIAQCFWMQININGTGHIKSCFKTSYIRNFM